MSGVVKADVRDRILDWLTESERRGLSSETMAFTALTPTPSRRYNICPHPLDSFDLQRCADLVAQVPEVRESFPQIAALSPEWTVLIDHWDELAASLAQERPTMRAPKTYARMCELFATVPPTTEVRS